ncbi:MAG: ATP-binding cassette domain-containing protein [Oligoflexales bacterium]|nr:ATP-binding cassette domain-containing protein [Oligoflexales bacterium]
MSLLEVKDLKVHFPVHGGIFYRRVGTVYAADGVSFSVSAGETIGLVGESGCGKTTVGRAILQLYRPSSGKVVFDGIELTERSEKELRKLRREMQVIFQDPFESLNSRLSVGDILREPFDIHNIGKESERVEMVERLLEKVGLPASSTARFPHEFSGGQRQRIGIARAIALKPKLIVCDEAVSALDVSIQSQILNLLLDIQKEMGVAYIFIAHDLAVVKHISDKIAVMYLGKVVEFASSEELYNKPLHPYTEALISAIPEPDPKRKKTQRIILRGDVPSPRNPPAGCPFHTRCPKVMDLCRTRVPELTVPKTNSLGVDNIHQVACHLYSDN